MAALIVAVLLSVCLIVLFPIWLILMSWPGASRTGNVMILIAAVCVAGLLWKWSFELLDGNAQPPRKPS